MKLATLKNESRDGQLALVSRDLTRALVVPEIARTLQAALDDWQRVAPRLAQLSVALDAGETRHAIAFDPRQAHSPLRAYQWVDGSAYVNHVELVRRARGATMPPEF
jgi:fumarylacetoacetate (FAA) hydrolase